MNIKEEQDYKEVLYRLIDLYSAFETCLQEKVICKEVQAFMLEDPGNNYESFEELKLDIEQVQVPNKPFSSKKILYSEKIIAFLY